MKQTFDYLENAAVSATVCDKDGIVVYQNKVAQNRDGDAIGKKLFKCHSPRSNEKIRHMLEAGESNTYETIKHGKRHFIHHTPWYENEGGEISGLIEFEIDIPDSHPTYNRDKE